MADISLDLIKEVRERTGAGLMDCKKALVENKSDVSKAIDWLREKGIAKVAKKAETRIAAEGNAVVLVDKDKAVLLEINCETDFVAANDIFKDLVNKVAALVLEKEPKTKEEAMTLKGKDGKTVNDYFLDAGIKFGEKLDFRRFVIVKKKKDEIFGEYVHLGGKIASLAVLQGGDSEVAKGVVLNVCSLNPTYITKEDIPEAEIDKEMEIQLEASKNDPSFSKKPEDIQKKIIRGRVEKTFNDSVLTEGSYILDDSLTIGQLLTQKKAKVVAIYRYEVGEGIEKRQDDFAAEVAAQAKI